MKYVLGALALVILISFGAVWAIAHFWFILKVLIPLGFAASFIAGYILGLKVTRRT